MCIPFPVFCSCVELLNSVSFRGSSVVGRGLYCVKPEGLGPTGREGVSIGEATVSTISARTERYTDGGAAGIVDVSDKVV